MHFVLAKYAWHSFKESIKKKLLFLALWVRYSDRFHFEAMANGSERMPIIEFIISHGQENKTYTAYWFVKSDWSLI